MMYVVRCPACRARSRAAALGSPVACPGCGEPFVPVAEPPQLIPTVPRLADRHHPGHHDPDPHAITPTLIGLAFLPLGIPLLWLVGPILTGKEPIFSFAAPVALAVGLGGLGIGVGLAHGWGHAAKVRGVVALALVGYFCGGFLYFLKKEWAEAIRRDLDGPISKTWKPFAGKDIPYRVEFPAGPVVKTDPSPLPGWELIRYRWQPANPKAAEKWTLLFEVAHGPLPTPNASDDDWFAAAKAAVLQAAAGAELTSEASLPFLDKGCTGREYRLTLADGTTNRIVRVYRHLTRPLAFYQAVEGTFLPADADYVKRFFVSFRPVGG